MKIADAIVTPKKMWSVPQTLVPYLSRSLRNYFNQQPTYIPQGGSSQGEILTRKLARGIEVKLGGITIPFTD